ncbi:putative cytochrome P450 [Helianthus annuus]|uniref:Cytochrome P450 n=1 Tax=Helianthus annuus TaxID=4232 RepID=A0A9K3IRN9_HELAN|nr:putative cytochrome P450 [Helianthus annuus]KAJ0559800.1 putative cytochrome P450 [Helianthus annuus]KAJ0565907.1 putative cytochrome P450 [Helianthus annuus]KAJ0572777.1 putative cytochrome P450 [Helianthus annuus]KAJ0910963.1 putative cytochrome P450 [Helianthus annuus]
MICNPTDQAIYVFILLTCTYTTTATLKWALAFLVNHPVVLKIAQQELENHDGRDRKVEESDMNNLVYLQAIIKETMRLYRAAPLSVPHESTEDCIVGGLNKTRKEEIVVVFHGGALVALVEAARDAGYDEALVAHLALKPIKACIRYILLFLFVLNNTRVESTSYYCFNMVI